MVLDLHMPVMDGHVFLEKAGRQQQFQRIPVIVLSVSNQPVDAQHPDQPGASGHLVKPELFEDMKNLIRVVIAHRNGTVQLPTVGDLGG